MGFGKWVVGIGAAVGAVIAAPVVLPMAGAAIAGSALTGAAGVTAGFAIAGAGATTAGVATAGAIAGGSVIAAGNAIEKAQEKRIDAAYSRGVETGSYGKEELIKAHEKEVSEKEAIITNQADIISKQDEYIKVQDEFIDGSEMTSSKDLSYSVPRPAKDDTSNVQMVTGNLIPCKNCGKMISSKAKKCPKCKTVF